MHRLTAFSLRRPWLTLGLLLVVTGVLGAGAPRVKPAYGFRVLVGSEHPAIKALDSPAGRLNPGSVTSMLTLSCNSELTVTESIQVQCFYLIPGPLCFAQKL